MSGKKVSFFSSNLRNPREKKVLKQKKFLPFSFFSSSDLHENLKQFIFDFSFFFHIFVLIL